MLEKINVADIIVGHWKTLYSFRRERMTKVRSTSKGDVCLFYVAPAIATAIALYFGFRISSSASNLLLAAMAIFAGLLFNLLMLLHSILGNTESRPRSAQEKQLLREIYANISYALLTSLTTLVPLVVVSSLTDHSDEWIKASATGVSSYLLLHFALTMLMVLRRMHTLLKDDFAS